MPEESKPHVHIQKRAEETRESIISAGATLFCQEGYHKVSSKKIAGAANVAVGSFYNHFKDKKELLIEIHSRHAKSIHQLIEDKLTQGFSLNEFDSAEFSKQLVKQVLKLHSLSPELHREIAALSYSDPDFATVCRAEEKKAVQNLVRILEAHRSKLRIDDIEAASWVITLSIETVIHSMKIFGPPIAGRRLTETLGDMIQRLLFKAS